MDLNIAREISVEYNGKEYRAYYTVQKGLITVIRVNKRKCRKMENLPNEDLARHILKEMIMAGDL